MRIALLGLATSLACGDSTVAPAEPEPVAVKPSDGAVPTQVPTPPRPSTVTPAASGTGTDTPSVVLVWAGIGAYHRGLFSTEHLVSRLAQDLASHVASPARVHVRFDDQQHEGHIELDLQPGALRNQVGGEGSLVGLQDLAPITTGLARYRSAVAGNYDLRIESFIVGIGSRRASSSCMFGILSTPFPDGRTVSNCVQIDGTEHCGSIEPGGIRFDAGAAEKIWSCLR